LKDWQTRVLAVVSVAWTIAFFTISWWQPVTFAFLFVVVIGAGVVSLLRSELRPVHVRVAWASVALILVLGMVLLGVLAQDTADNVRAGRGLAGHQARVVGAGHPTPLREKERRTHRAIAGLGRRADRRQDGRVVGFLDAWHRERWFVDEPIKDEKERSSDDYIGEQDREWLADAVPVEVDRVSQE
jgi:hypothetical protein